MIQNDEKSCFLKSALFQNFWIQWYSNILQFLEYFDDVKKIWIQWFSLDVTTKYGLIALLIPFESMVSGIPENLIITVFKFKV